jgi:hypothetical protein
LPQPKLRHTLAQFDRGVKEKMRNYAFDKPRLDSINPAQRLSEARLALTKAGRYGGQPKPEKIIQGMYEAIESILKYLEEKEEHKPIGSS